MNRHLRRGFTAVEILVVIAIAAAIAALAYDGFGRLRRRAHINGTATELHAALYGARQSALATGHRMVVMVFPDFPKENTGRLVIYEDLAGDFFSDKGAVNFAGYDPDKPVPSAGSDVLEVIDLPEPWVVVGPEVGQGKAAAMPAPYAGVAINTFCSFCTGANRRGALAFDQVGTVSFYDKNGAALDHPQGGSFTIVAPEASELRTFVISTTTGAVQTLRSQVMP